MKILCINDCTFYRCQKPDKDNINNILNGTTSKERTCAADARMNMIKIQNLNFILNLFHLGILLISNKTFYELF